MRLNHGRAGRRALMLSSGVAGDVGAPTLRWTGTCSGMAVVRCTPCKLVGLAGRGAPVGAPQTHRACRTLSLRSGRVTHAGVHSRLRSRPPMCGEPRPGWWQVTGDPSVPDPVVTDSGGVQDSVGDRTGPLPVRPTGADMPDDGELARRAAGAPRVLPGEPTGLGRGAPLLYLDQQVWVRLLRGGPEVARLHQRLLAAVADGSVVTCLSAAHYAETWHRGEWESRWALARLMWDASRLVTLAPLHALHTAEVAHAMGRLGVPLRKVPASPDVVGRGVNHAFDSPTGRLRFLESLGPDGDEGPVIPLEKLPPEEQRLYRGGSAGYEWFSLAGLPCDMRMDGLDMETQRREGQRFVAEERRLAELLTHRGPEATLGEAVTGNDLSWIWDSLSDVCESSGIDPNGFLQALAERGGRPAVEEFVRSMPAFGLLHDLRVLRHQNPQQPWRGNDRRDLFALAVAATYCQAVVTERHWKHLLTRLGIRQRTAAHVTSDLGAALEALNV